jgi:predicted amidophosphoribosyltransferase
MMLEPNYKKVIPGALLDEVAAAPHWSIYHNIHEQLVILTVYYDDPELDEVFVTDFMECLAEKYVEFLENLYLLVSVPLVNDAWWISGRPYGDCDG